MFVVYHDKKTGEIKAYTECPQETVDGLEEISGCDKAVFSNADGVFNEKGNIMVRVSNGQLILKNSASA